MNISGVSLEEFSIAVRVVSTGKYDGNIIVAQDAHNTGYRKPRCTARLAADNSHGAGARVSWSGRHGPWACWHAYRDVLAAVFDANPDAVIRTGIGGGTLYRGRDGFRAAYPATAGVNIGSQVQPAYMPDLCDCDDTEADDVPRQEPDWAASRPIIAAMQYAQYARAQPDSGFGDTLASMQYGMPDPQDEAEYASTAPTSDATRAYEAIEEEFTGTWANTLHP